MWWWLLLLMVGSSVWTQKSLDEYDEEDFEKLYQQWSDNDDDPIPEFIENKRPSREELLKADRPILVVVHLRNSRNNEDAKRISHLWQTLLVSSGSDVQRYVLGHDKIIYSVKPGKELENMKKFLDTLQSPYCLKYVIDSKEVSCEFNGNDNDEKTDDDEL